MCMRHIGAAHEFVETAVQNEDTLPTPNYANTLHMPRLMFVLPGTAATVASLDPKILPGPCPRIKAQHFTRAPTTVSAHGRLQRMKRKSTDRNQKTGKPVTATPVQNIRSIALRFLHAETPLKLQPTGMACMFLQQKKKPFAPSAWFTPGNWKGVKMSAY